MARLHESESPSFRPGLAEECCGRTPAEVAGPPLASPPHGRCARPRVLRATISAPEPIGANETENAWSQSQEVAEVPKRTKPVDLLSPARIERLIRVVRVMGVMLDRDLALCCGAETGALNRAASRNAEGFPTDSPSGCGRRKGDL